MSTHAWAQSDPNIATGFRFLTIGGAPRAVALAETMVAESNDAFVTEYNPAGLNGIKRFVVSFAHNSFFQDTRGEYIATAIPTGAWTIGARMGYVGTGEIPLRTGPSEDPIGFYDATSGVFQGALARTVDDRLSLGISAALVVEHLETETASSAILGLGAHYHAHRVVDLGFAFVNVGPKAKFEERDFKMPNQVRFGVAWKPERFSVRGEFVAAEHDDMRWHFGGELLPDPRLALRGGVRLGYDAQFFDAGLGVRTVDQRIEVDYAFAPYSDDLGSTHRFGLTVRP